VIAGEEAATIGTTTVGVIVQLWDMVIGEEGTCTMEALVVAVVAAYTVFLSHDTSRI
jgi:hypothetical protein